ncbi:hypothetical protein QA601_14625 [Chitinispirillales bacterium ANBcel5]|uniref:hypothetical protein n=1 Tax=Cellulosispirillum alkaliphilum TaxID=3039283 RepID=UPI002A53D54E|nr:hypothetical protein [Chitinispirillales bacterium ANBcel5]
MLHFTEKLESDKILKLLSKALPYYLESWQDFGDATGLFGSTDPQSFNMRTVGSSSPVIEYVIRPHLNILCILSAFHYLKKSEIIEETINQKELSERIKKGVRWACDTHITGRKDVPTFLERKRWGENWRSSLWATVLAITSVFAGDILDKGLKRRTREIVAHEANRFIGVSPPSGSQVDTKVEENAQDAMVIAWAINLCEDHKNVPLWEKTLKIWSVNIASSVFDSSDHSQYFDHSVAKAVTTCNLFPDFTAENHGFFNPEILSYGLWLVLGFAAYSLHGRERPSFLVRKNHQRTFDILLHFCLPTGLIFAPGGHDMPMFIPRPLALAWGLWHKDPRALHLTSKLLAWMNQNLMLNKQRTGPWVFGFEQKHEGWELLFQSQSGLELALLAALPFTEELRGLSAGQVENSINTSHIYPFIEVCYRRNVRTTRSVAWKALGDHPQIGLSVHSQPELVAPFKAALLGIPSLVQAVKSWEVMFHYDRFQRDGFDTSGRIEYYGVAGNLLLNRDVRVLTWGDDGLLVLDQIVAQQDVDVKEQFLSPIYLVNDHWTGNNLDFSSGSLKESFSSFQKNFREVSCPSFWASINSNLLFQFVWGRTKGLFYLPGGMRNAPPYWKNCRVDMLGIHIEPASVKSGDTVYKIGYYIGAGKGPRSFKSSGTAQEAFKGLVIMDGKITVGLD